MDFFTFIGDKHYVCVAKEKETKENIYLQVINRKRITFFFSFALFSTSPLPFLRQHCIVVRTKVSLWKTEQLPEKDLSLLPVSLPESVFPNRNMCFLIHSD